jgi:hypothetical protein
MSSPDISEPWAVVVAALLGGCAVLLGGYVHRRWEEADRQRDAVEEVCQRLLSAPLALIFEIGWFAEPAARRFYRFRHRLLVDSLFAASRRALGGISEAKSMLDLKVSEPSLLSKADDLLESCRDFTEIALRESPPSKREVERARKAISKARNEFLLVANRFTSGRSRTVRRLALKRDLDSPFYP